MAKILIIDRDEILSGLYAQKLADCGFETRTVRTEDEAAAHVENFRPDVIVAGQEPTESLAKKAASVFLTCHKCSPKELAQRIRAKLIRDRLLRGGANSSPPQAG